MEQKESLEIDLHKYSELIFDKGTKTVQQSKDSLFNKKCWNNQTSTCKNKSRTDFIPFTKINLKSIIDLNVKCKTIKPLEDNIEENLDDPRYNNDFLGTTLKAQKNN